MTRAQDAWLAYEAERKRQGIIGYVPRDLFIDAYWRGRADAQTDVPEGSPSPDPADSHWPVRYNTWLIARNQSLYDRLAELERVARTSTSGGEGGADAE